MNKSGVHNGGAHSTRRSKAEGAMHSLRMPTTKSAPTVSRPSSVALFLATQITSVPCTSCTSTNSDAWSSPLTR